MKKSFFLHLALAGFVCCGFPDDGLAQPSCDHPVSRTWIRVEDANHHAATLWFGYATDASCGRDSAWCEDWVAEPCGAPADFFCTWWMVCEDTYYLKTYNYHGPGSSGQPDTFRLAFWPGPPDPRYPVRLSWSSAGVAALYDSAVIKDLFGGLFYSVRMDLDSAVILDSSWTREMNIHTFGITTPVNEEEIPTRPHQTRLLQNYPNPFNPSTQITYTLPSRSSVSLRIFNLSGEDVATLISGRMESGRHTSVWNAGAHPGGVYFYRFAAGDFFETGKMILVK